MWKVRGQVDLTALASNPESLAATSMDSSTARISLPGVELTWRLDQVSHAHRDGILALVLGRPRSSNLNRRFSPLDWIDLFSRKGVGAALEVGGSFAVILIDAKTANLWLIVDRFAGETLCYCSSGAHVCFSERACDVPGPEKSIDPQCIYDYLYFHVIPAPKTIFRDVFRVDAGSAAHFRTAATSIVKWWVPAFVESNYSNLDERKREFAELVQQSVVEEADDERTACFLSGGTDSSSVAGMLARARGRDAVQCYSIGFEAEGYDEMAYARIAAQHFGLRHHEYYVTPQDVIDSIPAVAASFDQPFGNSSVLPTYYCALRAKEDGYSRMLAGDGGDELFGGNSRYAIQQLFELYRLVPKKVRESILEPVAHGWSAFREIPGLRQLGGYIRHSSLQMPDRLETFNLLNRIGTSTLLRPEFLAQIDALEPLRQQRTTYQAIESETLLNRMLAYDWKYTLADSDLPKVRGATLLAGTSVGYPLLSRQLTNFSIQLPANWKLRHTKLRWFFKEALFEFLPQEILKKKKHGFGLPFGPWTLRDRNLRELALTSLERVVDRGIVNEAFVGRLFSEHLQEAPGYYGEIAWILLMLEHWLDAHASGNRF